jgi:arginase
VGLYDRLKPSAVHRLERPPYALLPQPGTRIRNGLSIRRYSEALARQVSQTLASGKAPLVIGGDCSNLLGCLLGVRRVGRCGLVHVDGHSDFFHPGNYDTTARLGSAAGMDLALATGRGETLLTVWEGIDGPLVADADVVQIGERDELDPNYAYRDVQGTAIHQLTVRHVKATGIAAAAKEAVDYVRSRGLERLWLHVDVDVLDENVMPAVDSPGSPGLDFTELTSLLSKLCLGAPVIGADIAVFDPDLDPTGVHAANLATCLGHGLAHLGEYFPIRQARP